MNKLLHDVMRLAGQLPERDQRYIAGEVVRIIRDLIGPSWAERVRDATPREPPKDLQTFLEEAVETLSRASRHGSKPAGRRPKGSA
jgi:hypothetical protein